MPPHFVHESLVRGGLHREKGHRRIIGISRLRQDRQADHAKEIRQIQIFLPLAARRLVIGKAAPRLSAHMLSQSHQIGHPAREHCIPRMSVQQISQPEKRQFLRPCQHALVSLIHELLGAAFNMVEPRAAHLAAPLRRQPAKIHVTFRWLDKAHPLRVRIANLCAHPDLLALSRHPRRVIPKQLESVIPLRELDDQARVPAGALHGLSHHRFDQPDQQVPAIHAPRTRAFGLLGFR